MLSASALKLPRRARNTSSCAVKLARRPRVGLLMASSAALSAASVASAAEDASARAAADALRWASTSRCSFSRSNTPPLARSDKPAAATSCCVVVPTLERGRGEAEERRGGVKAVVRWEWELGERVV